MSEVLSKYEPVIGLEVHAQMKTKSKAFCSCSTEFNAPPNTNVCPICLGHPGTLPVLNKNLVEFILRIGLVTNCKITSHSIFARKNYFYPDLPKGYQISQYDKPICYDGCIEVNDKKIGITRIHMEEDAGKSIHDFKGSETMIDLNRCGVPLIEIVSEPDIRSSEEAYLYLVKLKQLVQYLEICDANMEEGSLRCDANVSIRLKGEKKLGVKTEVKNLNSFKNITDALEAEIKRQTNILSSGEKVIHQTLTYDARTKSTSLMRSKEEAHDYRYFPEPDLVTVHVDEDWKNKIKLPELPDKKMERFAEQYSLTKYDAEVLTQDKEIADYFEKVVKNAKNKSKDNIKTISTIIQKDVRRVLNEEKINISQFTISPINLAELSDSTTGGIIHISSGTGAVFNEMFKVKDRNDQRQKPDFIIKEKNLSQISDTSEIKKIVLKVIDENPNEVKRYKGGEKKLLGFFIGKVMKESKGKANPKTVNELIESSLK